MADKGIYNQPPKHFSNEDLKVVVILVRAHGTKRG
jgi:hypothetical protein